MKLQQFWEILEAKQRLVIWALPILAIVSWLLLYRLGSLVSGLSSHELTASRAAVGWHGIYQHPLDLPLQLVRSVVFYSFPEHGQFLTRLPNIVFGGLAILAYAAVVRLWHGTRTAGLATLLFACSAWTLHVSRLASFDVLYLWAIPTLWLSQLLLHKYGRNPLVWYGSLIVWGLLLYIPGLIWLLLLSWWLQRRAILQSWRHFKSWRQRALSGFIVLSWLPLLVVDLTRPGQLLTWLGWPEHIATGTMLAKQFLAVPVHLFARGPQYPELWLGKAPLFDIFTLVVCALGIYFYIRHWRAARTRLLAGLFLIGVLLVGLGGLVSLSLLVPLLYLAAATGLAYLSREWLRVFPHNPLARGLGISLIVLAVGLSCLYNLRAYFVAWPHTAVTRSTFVHHP